MLVPVKSRVLVSPSPFIKRGSNTSGRLQVGSRHGAIAAFPLLRRCFIFRMPVPEKTASAAEASAEAKMIHTTYLVPRRSTTPAE